MVYKIYRDNWKFATWQNDYKTCILFEFVWPNSKWYTWIYLPLSLFSCTADRVFPPLYCVIFDQKINITNGFLWEYLLVCDTVALSGKFLPKIKFLLTFKGNGVFVYLLIQDEWSINRFISEFSRCLKIFTEFLKFVWQSYCSNSCMQCLQKYTKLVCSVPWNTQTNMDFIWACMWVDGWVYRFKVNFQFSVNVCQFPN